MKRIDFNCDMGESFGLYKIGDDEGLMPHITIANVACGFHASDPTVMASTVRLAKQHNVTVGAHPSLPDLQGFGRREMKMPREELMRHVRGPGSNANGEIREQRRDEVCPRVHRLGDEAEAVRREPDAQLEHDERRRRGDGDER